MTWRRWLNVANLSLILLILVTAGHYWLHYDFTIDDAAISFSYARSWAEGNGWGALFPGAARVEGYSNFLWVTLLGVATRLGIETLQASKLLGLLFVLAGIVTLHILIRPYVKHTWFLFGLLLVPLSLAYIFWTVSGLESALYTFLILLSIWFLLREDEKLTRVPLGSAICLTLLAMTRPEGLLFAAAAFFYKLLQIGLVWLSSLNVNSKSTNTIHAQPEPNNPQADPLKARLIGLMVWSLAFIIGYSTFKAWHLSYFAYPWPNPVYAKAAWRATDLVSVWAKPEGWVYLRGYFRTHGARYALPVVLIGVILSLRSRLRLLLFFTLASLVLPLYVPDWMINYRFLVPFIPLQAALIVLAGDELWEWIRSGSRLRLWARLLILGAAGVLGLGLATFAWANLRLSQNQLRCGYAPWVEPGCLNGSYYWSMSEIAQMYSNLPEYANQLGLQDPIYLVPDIGGTSYVLDLRLVDLAGLGDVQIAHAGDQRLIEQYLFFEKRPDFVRTHSAWTRRMGVTDMESFWQQYVPITQRKDSRGLIHGEFVRKDLFISSSPPDVLACQEGSGDASMVISDEPERLNLKLDCIISTYVTMPGNALQVETFWQATQVQMQDWALLARLVDASGNVTWEGVQPLGYGWYSTSAWQPDQVIRQHLSLPADLPKGSYMLDLRLVDDQGFTQTDSVATLPIMIDESAAQSYVIAKKAEAARRVTQNDFLGALESLHFAEQVDADTPGLSAQFEATTQRALFSMLEQAKGQYENDDLRGMLETLQQAVELRGRRRVNPEWATFSRLLQQAAKNALAQSDYEDGYYLYWAALESDPNNAWAGSGLEQARRLYLGVQ